MTTATSIRVTNSQVLNRSILIDKIDRSQGNTEGYAQLAKFAVYVPYTNPVDPTVKGYIDLPPTDEVMLSLNEPKGTLAYLAQLKYITTLAYAGSLIVTPA